MKKWPKYAGISQNTKSPKTNSWNLKNHPLKKKKTRSDISTLHDFGLQKAVRFRGVFASYLRISQNRISKTSPGVGAFPWTVPLLFSSLERSSGDVFS